MFNLKETKAERFYYNRLYHDFVFNFDSVSSHYFYDFHKTRDFKKRAEDIGRLYDGRMRNRIAEILEETNTKLDCSTTVKDNIGKIKNDDTFVVIGGQQPGLFTGPIFIIYKILSIIRLSEYISAALNINTVPVFWNASDDSNFSQINSIGILDGDLEIMELELSGPGSASGGKRFSDLLLPQKEFTGILEELNKKLKKTDFSASINDFLKESIDKTCSLKGDDGKVLNPATLFSVIISKLFSRYGLILLDPSHPDLKKILAGSAMFDLKNAAAVRKKIKKSGDMLVDQGYHAQLKLDADSMDFFMVKNGIRYKISKNKNGQFVFDGDTISAEDLIRLVDRSPECLSPGVVLRPLFQDTILPVMATVCGPGEISYFAQLKEVYDIAGIKTGVLFPRFSATIIEGKIVKSMRKAGIELNDLGVKKQHVLNRILKNLAGDDVENLLQEFEKDIFARLNEIKRRITYSDPDTGSSFDRIERNLKKESSVLKKKIYSGLKNKNITLSQNIDKVFLNVFPGDDMQERTVNVFSYINKYDFCLLESLYDNIDPVSSTHKFIVFDDL